VEGQGGKGKPRLGECVKDKWQKVGGGECLSAEAGNAETERGSVGLTTRV